MSVFDVLLIGVGLSMDAFAVSICKGLASHGFRPKTALCCGVWFGGFQILMPLLGYFLGSTVTEILSRYAGVVAFLLLLLIGGHMIRETFGEDGGEKTETDELSPSVMLPLAVATAIDALAVGVSFAAYRMRVFPAACLIGLTTFTISAAGVWIGSAFGDRYQKKAQRAGGVILILIGLKLLLGL